MRIITGIYKGRRFDVPRSFKARPTTDFAKENIFNVLNAYTDFDGSTASRSNLYPVGANGW
jgi:16S rRNA G966 N2-methylase RsmD